MADDLQRIVTMAKTLADKFHRVAAARGLDPDLKNTLIALEALSSLTETLAENQIRQEKEIEGLKKTVAQLQPKKL